MSESISGTTAAHESPYPLRGHHLGLIIESYSPQGAADTAYELVATMEGYRGDATSQTADMDLLVNAPSPLQLGNDPELLRRYLEAYGIDVIGDTDEQGDEVERLTAEHLRYFQGLENEHPVRMMVGSMDHICGTCVFKLHCQDTSDNMLRTDYDSIDFTQKAANYLGLQDRVAVSSGEDWRSSQLATDAGTLRSVIGMLLAIEPQIPHRLFNREIYEPGFDLFSQLPPRS